MEKSLHKNTFWFDILLVILACVAASVDVMSYYRLGHVFTANMTGNTILLGLAIGKGNVASSLHSLASLGGFFAGTVIGASFVENTRKTWSYYITLSTAVESAIIFVLVMIWYKEDVVTNNYVLFGSILLAAIAMGIQSATIRHLNIPGVVTTFLTGTITSVGAGLIEGVKRGFKKNLGKPVGELPIPPTLERRILLQLVVFLAYGGTAILTGWLEFLHSSLLPFLPLTLIVMVLLIVIGRPGHPHLESNLKNTRIGQPVA